MLDSPRKRPWRVIADELASETDGSRILELSQELNDALDELMTRARPRRNSPEPGVLIIKRP